MSYSAPSAVASVPREDLPDDVTAVDDDAVHTLLNALDDADCRAILDVTGDRALCARELSSACDLPLSTTYRKLEMLVEANLLGERTRIRRSGKGKHASEYFRLVEEVVVAVDAAADLDLFVVEREPPE